MTDKELLQMALEWVEWFASDDHSVRPTSKAREIAEAIKARLAQPEPEHWSDCAVYNEPAYPKDLCNCGGFPVAWADLKGIRLEFDIEDCFSFIKKEDYVPLYTTPPKKEWVGLTDYEIVGIASLNQSKNFSFARAIEAKLKEKNSG